MIRPGGELRFYEHVRAERPAVAFAQRAVDPFWPHAFGGCHTARDTAGAIAAAGFEIHEQRSMWIDPLLVVAPHVLGRARRP